MNLPIFLNREFKKPEDDWYHVVPKGEFPHGSGALQVVDDIALASMVNRFNEQKKKPTFPGLLVDFDHFSYDTSQSSQAAGWISEMQNRQDGLWAKIRWTDLGDEAISKGRFRLTSPTWQQPDVQRLDNSRIRPLRLDSVALTNNPNLKGMVPLTNRTATPAEADKQQEPIKNSMKQVCINLGLFADASEEAALAEVNKLRNRAETAEKQNEPLKNRVTELEKEHKTLLETQVEADLETYQNRFSPEKKDLWKTALLANREGSIELLKSLPEPATHPSKTKPIFNRKDCKTPDNQPQASASKANLSQAEQQNAAVTEYMNRNNCKFEKAWAAVQKEKPLLFTKESDQE